MIIPIRDKVLIRPFPSDEISEFGIYVPASFTTRNNKATVVAVGNGIAKRKMKYKAGDVVHHIKDCGQEIIENGEKLYLIADIDILAIVN